MYIHKLKNYCKMSLISKGNFVTPLVFICFVCVSFADKNKESSGVFSSLSPDDRPFRMQKLNLVWIKAMQKLPKEKLKTLFTDLKFQDKDEIAWKKQKAEGAGNKEAKAKLLEASFNAILDKHGLARDFIEIDNSLLSTLESKEEPGTYFKQVFRDKKLNKLWLKAEKQGFTVNQLKALKEEFEHHQNKIDNYYKLMEKVNKEPWFKDDPDNNIQHLMDTEEGKKAWKEVSNPHQALKAKHSELKEGYSYLTGQVLSQKRPEFDEPQVQSLWELAKNASFSEAELQNLKEELGHFEHRVRKLRIISMDEMTNKNDLENLMEEDLKKHQLKLKQFNYKIEKTKTELENRILERHTEL